MKKTIKLFSSIFIAVTVLSLLNSCFNSSGNNSIVFTSSPFFELNPSGNAPLAGILSFTTNKPVRVEIAINDGTNSWPVQFLDLNLIHEHTILGLKPDRTHSITIIVFDEFGNETQADTVVQVTTDPLPADFPSYEVLVADTAKMEPGFTVAAVAGLTSPGYLYIVNTTGDVVWYSSLLKLQDYKKLANGNFLIYQAFFGPGFHDILEMDMLGNIVHSWKTPYSDSDDPDRVEIEDTAVFHHEVYPMPNKNYLSIDVELRTIDNYPLQISFDPADAAITGPAKIAGDVIVEFEPDGTVVKRWHLFDILDPQRVSYHSDSGVWGMMYPDTDGDDQSEGAGSMAWTMSNAVIYDASDDTIIVSVRHQDIVIKIDRNDTIVWILGNPSGWNAPYTDALLDLVGQAAAEWQYHQHAPMLTSTGTLLLFDNGNNRSIPFTGIPPMAVEENYSRAVEFEINSQTMEVTQLWEYGTNLGADKLYSDFVGDADEMPITGNILITFGGMEINDPGYATQIIEVTHDDEKEVVFKLVVDNTNTYRAARIGSLY